MKRITSFKPNGDVTKEEKELMDLLFNNFGADVVTSLIPFAKHYVESEQYVKEGHKYDHE